MNIHSFNQQQNYSQSFKSKKEKSSLSKKEKTLVLTTTALGIATASAILAKKAGYSLKPNKIFKNIKNSYLAKVDFHDKEVITIGAGSVLGGLTGGLLISKTSEEKKAKMREAILQMGNIAIPISIVEFISKKCKKYGNIAQSIGAITGVLSGVIVANILMNKINDVIFKNKDGRGVKITDFSAHLDDTLLAASYISKADIIQNIARIIPVALGCAGYEVGTKTTNKKEG